jgi:hypothetical protein
LQLEDGSVFFLDGATQLLKRHGILDQFPGKSRDLRIPELERGLRLLQCGVLLMELALRLLPGRALILEGGLSLLEGGSLPLELALRLLTRAPLLAKLLLHHGERGGLLLQVST